MSLSRAGSQESIKSKNQYLPQISIPKKEPDQLNPPLKNSKTESPKQERKVTSGLISPKVVYSKNQQMNQNQPMNPIQELTRKRNQTMANEPRPLKVEHVQNTSPTRPVYFDTPNNSSPRGQAKLRGAPGSLRKPPNRNMAEAVVVGEHNDAGRGRGCIRGVPRRPSNEGPIRGPSRGSPRGLPRGRGPARGRGGSPGPRNDLNGRNRSATTGGESVRRTDVVVVD